MVRHNFALFGRANSSCVDWVSFKHIWVQKINSLSYESTPSMVFSFVVLRKTKQTTTNKKTNIETKHAPAPHSIGGSEGQGPFSNKPLAISGCILGLYLSSCMIAIFGCCSACGLAVTRADSLTKIRFF